MFSSTIGSIGTLTRSQRPDFDELRYPLHYGGTAGHSRRRKRTGRCGQLTEPETPVDAIPWSAQSAVALRLGVGSAGWEGWEIYTAALLGLVRGWVEPGAPLLGVELRRFGFVKESLKYRDEALWRF